MSFQSNIPKATDLISVSQGDLLNNFTSMQSTYTTDHYGFNPITNLGFHKHVTMPNDTGNIPTPAAGIGSEFAVTVNGATYPFWRRDGLATLQNYTMMPIKAFGGFTTANPPVSTFTLPYGNVSAITRNSAGNYTVTFIDPMPNTTYIGIISQGNVVGAVNLYSVTTKNTASCVISSGNASDSGGPINFAIIF